MGRRRSRDHAGPPSAPPARRRLAASKAFVRDKVAIVYKLSGLFRPSLGVSHPVTDDTAIKTAQTTKIWHSQPECSYFLTNIIYFFDVALSKSVCASAFYPRLMDHHIKFPERFMSSVCTSLIRKRMSSFNARYVIYRFFGSTIL